MKLYFSGIAGTGIRPLAELAAKAGYEVFGSDANTPKDNDLEDLGAVAFYGKQDGKFLKNIYDKNGIDWFIYTSALTEDHPELKTAKALGLKISKRDEFLAHFIDEKKLKLIAVAGTHGKTTTTAMIVWTLQELGHPASHIVGTTMQWAKAGDYISNSEYFIYEADEYDRNFLSFHPWLSIIITEDYDHTDIYKTKAEYHEAFEQFRRQSERVIENINANPKIELVGDLRRKDASLAFEAVKQALPDVDDKTIIGALNSFPGAGRRFERIKGNLFTDYAHHPKEIRATLMMAKELVQKERLSGVVAIYQPHQNIRQVEMKDLYKDAFLSADKLFWLPTFLTREDPKLKIITPGEFINKLENRDIAEEADLDDKLLRKVHQLLLDNYLVILLSAGPADTWLRENIDTILA